MFGALIDRSKVSRTYWDAAKLVAYQLRRRGESLPPELNDWAVDAFTWIRPRSVARGRDPYENTQRDWLIYVVVKKLEAVGFHATRNKATGDAKGTACAKGGTACDAVGQAFGLGYKAVEKDLGVVPSAGESREPLSPGDSSEPSLRKAVERVGMRRQEPAGTLGGHDAPIDPLRS